MTDYCPIQAWKRLKRKGYSPSISMDIARDVYRLVKKKDAKNMGTKRNS